MNFVERTHKQKATLYGNNRSKNFLMLQLLIKYIIYRKTKAYIILRQQLQQVNIEILLIIVSDNEILLVDLTIHFM